MIVLCEELLAAGLVGEHPTPREGGTRQGCLKILTVYFVSENGRGRRPNTAATRCYRQAIGDNQAVAGVGVGRRHFLLVIGDVEEEGPRPRIGGTSWS